MRLLLRLALLAVLTAALIWLIRNTQDWFAAVKYALLGAVAGAVIGYVHGKYRERKRLCELQRKYV